MSAWDWTLELEVTICDLQFGGHFSETGVIPMKKAKWQAGGLIPTERIEKSILLIRGQKVLLDFDLAELYDVETKVLSQSNATSSVFQTTSCSSSRLKSWKIGGHNL
jgi:hypothetical protein